MSKTVRAAERQISVDAIARVAGLAADAFAPRHGWSNQAWMPEHRGATSNGRQGLSHRRRGVDSANCSMGGRISTPSRSEQ